MKGILGKLLWKGEAQDIGMPSNALAGLLN
jgi:hypothetical protein